MTDRDYALDCAAVAGAVDFRCAAARSPFDKADGPQAVLACVHKFVVAEMCRLWDPVTVEACFSLEVPLFWQGGDNAMIPKAKKVSQELPDQREIMLVDPEPKITGAVLRRRMCPDIKKTVVSSQCGDSMGGSSCELAHLALEAFTAAGVARQQTVIRLFVDVVSAFASIVVALTLPLERRNAGVDSQLTELGFSTEEIEDIWWQHANAGEWWDVSEHLQKLFKIENWEQFLQ